MDDLSEDRAYPSDDDWLRARRSTRGSTNPPGDLNPWRNGAPLPTRHQALLALQGREWLYAIRLPDGVIKIGHTTALHHRFYNHGPDCQIIGLRDGTREDEQALHDSLIAHRHHGWEYYHPTPEVLAIVNQWRTALGREAIGA